jgi:DNA repair exonuclease SbcCD ATPase subunit
MSTVGNSRLSADETELAKCKALAVIFESVPKDTLVGDVVLQIVMNAPQQQEALEKSQDELRAVSGRFAETSQELHNAKSELHTLEKKVSEVAQQNAILEVHNEQLRQKFIAQQGEVSRLQSLVSRLQSESSSFLCVLTTYKGLLQTSADYQGLYFQAQEKITASEKLLSEVQSKSDEELLPLLDAMQKHIESLQAASDAMQEDIESLQAANAALDVQLQGKTAQLEQANKTIQKLKYYQYAVYGVGAALAGVLLVRYRKNIANLPGNLWQQHISDQELAPVDRLGHAFQEIRKDIKDVFGTLKRSVDHVVASKAHVLASKAHGSTSVDSPIASQVICEKGK